MSFVNNSMGNDPELTYARVSSQKITVNDGEGFHFYTLPDNVPDNPDEDATIVIKPDGTTKLENVSALSVTKAHIQAQFELANPITIGPNLIVQIPSTSYVLGVRQDLSVFNNTQLSIKVTNPGVYYFSLCGVLDSQLGSEGRAWIYAKIKYQVGTVPQIPGIFFVRDLSFISPFTFSGLIRCQADDVVEFFIETAQAATGTITLYEDLSLQMYAI